MSGLMNKMKAKFSDDKSGNTSPAQQSTGSSAGATTTGGKTPQVYFDVTVNE
ncbi:MAG: hypothetical protein Q9226_009317, partial [Calogaya cf. arnoldii]